MENASQLSALQAEPGVATHPRNAFASEKEMKAYYLQLASILNVNFTEKQSEFTSLNCLHRKLKQFIAALQAINAHEWGTGIAEIHDTCGITMLLSQSERRRLLKANREIGLHLQFLTKLASKAGCIKQLLGILDYHYQNVEYLLDMSKLDTETSSKYLFEAASIAPSTPTQLHEYEDKVTPYRNIVNAAWIEGFKEGWEKGRSEERVKIARRLKVMGLDIPAIHQATSLSPEEIQKL